MDLVTSIGKYLRRHWHTAILWAGIAVCFAVVFYLYDLPLEAVLYAALFERDAPRRIGRGGFFSALSSAQETFGAGVPDYGGRGQSAGTQEPDR